MKLFVISLAFFAALCVNAQSDKKVFCYFTNWAWARSGIGKYTPEDIDNNLCTHVFYAFATLNKTSMEIQPSDVETDIEKKFYERVTAHKSDRIKVLISLGGWGANFSNLLSNAENMNTFTSSVTKFLNKYNLDGIDLDFEYPACWSGIGVCPEGNPQEKESFVQLVKKLSDSFNGTDYLLTAAVAGGKNISDAAYDIPELSKYFDFINLMTYDYHGGYDFQTGHVAPLYAYPGDKYDYLNVNYTVQYWIEKGAPPEKLILGFPLYGRSFTLKDPTNNGMNAPSSGNGNPGTYTAESGFISFYEICNNTKNNGWTVVRDEENRIGPYAFKGDQWVSYDDIDTIAIKIDYLKKEGLGGAMFWALDLDDFTDSCGCGKSPLLSKINHDLRHNVESNVKNCT